ncbi:YceI family protein [Labilibacter sediminis]|nr:YceI family protein [Labilibacter sediminis]
MNRIAVVCFMLTMPFLQKICLSQDKYKAEGGFISFYSSAPLEDIYAENNRVKSLIDLSTNELAFIVEISDFKFKKSLMQTHYNEKYMESHKFPQASFSGLIESSSGIKEMGQHTVIVKGDIVIHGVKNTIEVVAVLYNHGDSISANSKFNIRLDDFDIKIPKLLIKNIAEEVLVKVRVDYKLVE